PPARPGTRVLETVARSVPTLPRRRKQGRRRSACTPPPQTPPGCSADSPAGRRTGWPAPATSERLAAGAGADTAAAPPTACRIADRGRFATRRRGRRWYTTPSAGGRRPADTPPSQTGRGRANGGPRGRSREGRTAAPRDARRGAREGGDRPAPAVTVRGLVRR